MTASRTWVTVCVVIGLMAGQAASSIVIDDFEDGVINTTLWSVAEGNYAGGAGGGSVSEFNGALVLESHDTEFYGGGVACAVLRQSIQDVPVRFSFDLTLFDDTLSGPYIQHMHFGITDHDQADSPAGPGPAYENVYLINHDQQQQTNHYSGIYYFVLDSAAKEARLYDAADDSLLGSTSYASFGNKDPYFVFNAYTDTDCGSVSTTFALTEVSVVPEPATAGLFLLSGLLVARRRRGLR